MPTVHPCQHNRVDVGQILEGDVTKIWWTMPPIATLIMDGVKRLTLIGILTQLIFMIGNQLLAKVENLQY